MSKFKFNPEEEQHLQNVIGDFIDWMDQFSTKATYLLGLAVPSYILLHTFIF